MAVIFHAMAGLCVFLILPVFLLLSIGPRKARSIEGVYALLSPLCFSIGALCFARYANIPYTKSYLSISACMMTSLAGIILIFRGIRSRLKDWTIHPLWLVYATGWLLLVIPWTALAGIDTYKWQDYATNLAVDPSLSLLVHPLSWFGFTPRTCPIGHPALLTTVQMLFPCEVRGGFFIVSSYVGILAMVTTRILAHQLFQERQARFVWVILYILAPVMVRYGHWATGRGLFMALFPLMMLAMVHRSTSHVWLHGLPVFILLAMAHKVAWPVLVIGLILLALRTLLRNAPVPCRYLFVVAGIVGCLAWLPLLGLAGWMRLAIGRFVCLLPLSVLAVTVISKHPINLQETTLWLGTCMALPAALDPSMYGALPATLFLTWGGVYGLVVLQQKQPLWYPHLFKLIMLSAGIGALAVVMVRSSQAMPLRLEKAARFLDQQVPEGPIQLTGPGRPVNQVQAYLRACPLPSVDHTGTAAIQWRRPPGFSGSIDQTGQAWASYFRNPFDWKGFAIHYYGKSPQRYHLSINGVNDQLISNATCVYHDGPVALWKMITP